MKDNDIIRGIRENSEAAWRALYLATHDRFLPLISPFLKHKSETDYDDIYEQACFDLMDNVKDGKLREGENVNLSGYFYTICMRKALRANERRGTEEERMRKYGREKAEERAVEEASEEHALEAMMGFDPEAEQEADKEAWESVLELLDKALAGIPERCRAILRRYYWDKMPMKDIAAAMGLKNADVAKASKNKCMRKLENAAEEMASADKALEEAVRRVVERDALRDLLEEFRKESSGEWARAALDDKGDKKEE